jgi:extracellular elastinolytic metalloproteinase
LARDRWIKLALTALFAAVPATAVAAGTGAEKPAPNKALETFHGTDGPPNYDVRNTAAGRRNYASRSAGRRAAQTRLKRSLGAGGLLKVDPATGTPSWVASRTGFLTGKGGGGPRQIALGYVRDHAGAFGLDSDDMASLELRQQYTTKGGLTHLEYVQEYQGIAAFDNGLRVNLSGGRLVNVSGSPQPDLAVASTAPSISAESAAERALADVGVRRSVKRLSQRGAAKRTRLSGNNLATLVLFVIGTRTRLAWDVIASADEDHVYRSVVDAQNGEVLKRTNMVAHASGSVFLYYPGAPAGGSQVPQTFSTSGEDPWVASPFNKLKGDNVHSYTDPADTYHFDCGQSGCFSEGEPAAGDEVAPSASSGTQAAAWTDTQVRDTNNVTSDRFCPSFGCTWYGGAGGITTGDYDAPFAPGSNWQANRRQNTTQVHFFVNKVHDYAQNDPAIGFDDASGNFEESANGENPGDPAAPVGGDAVRAQADDGASTFNADFPDDAHENNANMLTLPEKDQNGPVPYPFKAPRMQMFLFSDFACNGSCGAGITDVNGGDDAAILYHEFVHGLSNRLVDPFGNGALGTDQGGAMGEAWSDVYAMDLLNAEGLQPDAPTTKGDVVFGTYEGMEGQIRTQPQDCPVPANRTQFDPICPQTPDTPYAGGYTYEQFGTILGQPEVHADGEIWAETLWDLRQAEMSALGAGTGQSVWRAVVTDGMRLAPADDTLDMLVMRDAILQANQVNGFGQANCQRIWSVFATRGMGADASSNGGNDVSPQEGFANPGANLAFCPADAGGGGGGGGGGTGTGTGDGGGTGGGDGAGSVTVSLAGAPRSITVSRRGTFTYRFRATPGSRGTATFASVRRLQISARRRVTFARRSFTAPGSGRVTLRIRLSRKNLRILRRNRRALVSVRVSARGPTGGTASTSRRLTLKAPRR